MAPNSVYCLQWGQFVRHRWHKTPVCMQQKGSEYNVYGANHWSFATPKLAHSLLHTPQSKVAPYMQCSEHYTMTVHGNDFQWQVCTCNSILNRVLHVQCPSIRNNVLQVWKRVLNCKQQRVTWWLVQILAWHLLSATGVVDEITCYKFQVLQLCSRLIAFEHTFNCERCWLGQSEHTEGNVYNKIINWRYSCWSS